ncbi:caspase family protein [Streptomyces sp. NPDC089799]|uniref:caspase family protein n=1 Tax=Streptomyces sp. NPDC089799 TaxID=3155066 RepID=UPI00343857DE
MRRFLVAAGTRHYLQDPELPRAHEDVTAVAELFTAAGYERVLAGVSLDPAAARFEEALADWCETAALEPEDAVVLYYAGHGHRAPGGYRLACADSRHGRPGSWLSLSALAEILAESPVRNVLFVVDACHAAAAGPEIAGVTEAIVSLRPRGDEPGSGTWLLASARQRETSEDGAFTGRLAAAWRQGDGPSQRHLSPAALAERITASFAADGLPQRAACSSLDQSRRPPFFPNPAFDPQAEIGPDGRPAAADSDLAAHFDPRGRGVEHVHDPGSYFTGRERALAAVRAHLAGGGGRAPLVVTADPGSGKSAVLGRLVLDGHADASVNARHQTMEAVLARLAATADARASCPEALLAALARRTRPLRIVVDSLDEAGPGGDRAEARRIAWDLLRPLGAVPCVRLVVGARREMLPHIGERVSVVDLDEPAYAEDTSTAAYVAKVLTDTGAPYAGAPEAARRIAAEAARRADRCFLVARMTATALLRGPLVDTSAPGWAEQLPSDVGGAFETYLRRLPRERHTATMALLTAAAFGEGNGLPRRTWLRAATELSGIPLAEADVDLLLEGDGSYLSHAPVDGTTYFRPYHQELTDHIKARTLRFRDLPDVQDCFVRVLRGLVPDGEWARAPAYVRSHLATHAAAAGRLDDLLDDAGFVLAADPVPLLAALRHATRRPLLSMAVERAAYLLADAEPGTDRPALLAYVARTYGEHGLAAGAEERAASVRRLAVDPRPVTPHRVVGRHAGAAYSTHVIDHRWSVDDTVLPGGRAVVAKPPDSRLVHLWMLDSPSRSGLLPHPSRVTGCALVHDPRAPSKAVTLDADGTLRVWDLRDQTAVLTMRSTGFAALLGTGAFHDGTHVAVCRTGAVVVVVDLATGRRVAQVPTGAARDAQEARPTREARVARGATTPATACVCHDRDGRARLLVCDPVRGTVTAYPLEGSGGAQVLLTGRPGAAIARQTRGRSGRAAVALCEPGTRLTLLDADTGRTAEAPVRTTAEYLVGGFTADAPDDPAPDDPTLVVTDKSSLLTLSLRTGPAVPPRLRGSFLTLAPFRHDGRTYAVTTGFEPQPTVVDTLSGAAVGVSLHGHESSVCALHVLSGRGGSGPELLVVGNDGTARLWTWTDVVDSPIPEQTARNPDRMVTWGGARGVVLLDAWAYLARLDASALDRSAAPPARWPTGTEPFSFRDRVEGADGRLYSLTSEFRGEERAAEAADGRGAYVAEYSLRRWGPEGNQEHRTTVGGYQQDGPEYRLLPPTVQRPSVRVVAFDPASGTLSLHDPDGSGTRRLRLPFRVAPAGEHLVSAAFTTEAGTAVLMTAVRRERTPTAPVTGRLWDCDTGRPVGADGIALLPGTTLLVPDNGPAGTRWIAQQGTDGATSVTDVTTGARFPVRGARQPGSGVRSEPRNAIAGHAFHLRWLRTARGAPVLVTLDHRVTDDTHPTPVSVWDSAAPLTVRRLPVSATAILWAGPAPNGEALVAVGDTRGVTLCHLPEGEQVWSMPLPALVTCLALFPGSPTLDMAIGTQQGLALVRPGLDPAWRRRLGLG